MHLLDRERYGDSHLRSLPFLLFLLDVVGSIYYEAATLERLDLERVPLIVKDFNPNGALSAETDMREEARRGLLENSYFRGGSDEGTQPGFFRGFLDHF
jgi:hypothetical protein